MCVVVFFQHMGDCAAVESMDEAQSLDTADRFVNCRCAGYMIRHDMITEASDIAAKFTRVSTVLLLELRSIFQVLVILIILFSGKCKC